VELSEVLVNRLTGGAIHALLRFTGNDSARDLVGWQILHRYDGFQVDFSDGCSAHPVGELLDGKLQHFDAEVLPTDGFGDRVSDVEARRTVYRVTPDKNGYSIDLPSLIIA
jgi:hypothetical protein